MATKRTEHSARSSSSEVGGHNLLVMGVSPRPGDQLFFGQVPGGETDTSRPSIQARQSP
jgi:hypothetical protein